MHMQLKIFELISANKGQNNVNLSDFRYSCCEQLGITEEKFNQYIGQFRQNLKKYNYKPLIWEDFNIIPSQMCKSIGQGLYRDYAVEYINENKNIPNKLDSLKAAIEN